MYLPPASGESIAEVYCRDGFDEEGHQQVGEGNIGQQQVARLRLHENRKSCSSLKRQSQDCLSSLKVVHP
jgi:hypothetical protein